MTDVVPAPTARQSAALRELAREHRKPIYLVERESEGWIRVIVGRSGGAPVYAIAPDSFIERVDGESYVVNMPLLAGAEFVGREGRL